MKLKKSVKIFIICFSLLIAISSGIYIYQKLNIEKEPVSKEENIPTKIDEEKIYKASFIATGDALIHEPIYLDAKLSDGTYDFSHNLEYIKPIIQNYDLAFYNQETIFAGSSLGYSTYPRFNTPSSFGDAMLDAGFNIVALSNNHSLDKGKQGILNALNYWENTEVMWNGLNDSATAKEKFIIHEKNGITYALLSYTTLTNGLKAPLGEEYLVNLYDKDQVAKDIASIRDKVDIVIVSMHWGVEYSSTVSDSQMEIASHLSECGANIIVGTHPHVLQPISKINNTVVMWSLGNFISSQRGSDRLTGALVSLDITKTVKNNHTTIELNNITAEIIYTYKTTNLKNYQVIPFSMMESKYLINYATVYETNKKILTQMDNTINIKPMN